MHVVQCVLRERWCLYVGSVPSGNNTVYMLPTVNFNALRLHHCMYGSNGTHGIKHWIHEVQYCVHVMYMTCNPMCPWVRVLYTCIIPVNSTVYVKGMVPSGLVLYTCTKGCSPETVRYTCGAICHQGTVLYTCALIKQYSTRVIKGSLKLQ